MSRIIQVLVVLGIAALLGAPSCGKSPAVSTETAKKLISCEAELKEARQELAQTKQRLQDANANLTSVSDALTAAQRKCDEADQKMKNHVEEGHIKECECPVCPTGGNPFDQLRGD